jgi:hypothetical protein
MQRRSHANHEGSGCGFDSGCDADDESDCDYGSDCDWDCDCDHECDCEGNCCYAYVPAPDWWIREQVQVERGVLVRLQVPVEERRRSTQYQRRPLTAMLPLELSSKRETQQMMSFVEPTADVLLSPLPESAGRHQQKEPRKDTCVRDVNAQFTEHRTHSTCAIG